jgi:hypothetical protein
MKKLTDKQRKALWLVVAVLVASYLFKSAANYARIQAYRRQAYQAWLQAQKKKQEDQTKGNTVGGENAPAPVEHLAGLWTGRYAPTSGICDIRVELKEGEPGKYIAYSWFSCIGNAVLMGDLRNGIPGLNPDTAILSGTMEKNAIRFHVDQTMGADAQGCVITALTVVYFGTGGISAEWQKGTCGGGHALLAKQRQ